MKEDLQAKFIFRSTAGSKIVSRVVKLGAQPIVVIEPSITETGEILLTVDSTDLEVLELVSILDMLSQTLSENKENYRVLEED